MKTLAYLEKLLRKSKLSQLSRDKIFKPGITQV